MSNPLNFNAGIYDSNNYIVLDWETTNLDKGSFTNPKNRIVLGCAIAGPSHRGFGGGVDTELQPSRPAGMAKRQIYSHFGSEYDQGQILDAVERADFIVCHHGKFELGWLARCGLDLRNVILWDTMIAEYVIYGNRQAPGGIGLDATLERRNIGRKMPYVSALIAGGVCPSEIATSDLEAYCHHDVNRAWSLFLRQKREISRLRLESVLYGRCFVTPMLADMETRGVKLDEEQVLSEHTSISGLYAAAESDLGQFGEGINWRSPKQVSQLVYDKLGFAELKDYRGQLVKTGSGGRSTATDTILGLRAHTADQRVFKQTYRRLADVKREKQILDQMLGCVQQDDGLLYAQFNQAITQNHRLSSTGGKWGLQFQNFPRNFKRLFKARFPGWHIIEGDCPQLEFRVAVDLTNDPVGKQDVLAGVDQHQLTSDVTGYNRQDSKPHTFKPLYGGNSGPPNLVAYYQAFRKKFQKIYDTQMGWVYEVLRNKQLRIASGLIFYWPDTEQTHSGYITNTPSIFNYPVSSFATADISLLDLCLVWHDLRGMDSFICNTVHDSGELECPEEELDKVERIMVDCYTVKIYDVLEKLFDYKFTTMMGLGVKSGTNWGVGTERKYESKLFNDRRSLRQN